MEMTLRWYGPGYDSVTLKQIRQIPGVKNVITTLFGKQAGELWLPKEIAELKMPDLNAASVEAAMSMVAGTARSMGIVVVD